MYIKKRMLLLTAIIMLLSVTTVEAKTVMLNKVKTEKSALYEVDQIITPCKEQDIGKNARAFVNGFKTDKKDTMGKLQDIALYLGNSRYQYEAIMDYNALISKLENNTASCYGYTLLSLKIMEKEKIPYKVVNVALRQKNGDVVMAHTCLLVKNGDDWVYFEPAKASYYKENLKFMNKKLAKDELIRDTIFTDYKKQINALVDYDEVNTRCFYVIDGNKPIKVQYKEFK